MLQVIGGIVSANDKNKTDRPGHPPDRWADRTIAFYVPHKLNQPAVEKCLNNKPEKPAQRVLCSFFSARKMPLAKRAQHARCIGMQLSFCQLIYGKASFWQYIYRHACRTHGGFMLAGHTAAVTIGAGQHTHTHIYIYIYIHAYACPALPGSTKREIIHSVYK